MTQTDPFEAAVDAIVSGDETLLRDLLARHPGLVRARSRRDHHAFLLHYIAANGVEDERQITPANAPVLARILLEAGADPNATAFAYGGEAATLGLLVSSGHPHKAGVQGVLAEILLDYGAAMKGEGNRSAAVTALAFGYADTAEILVRRGGDTVDLPVAAGLGLSDAVERLLPAASSEDRHRALALAAIHGRIEALRRLLDAGEDPNRFNPQGFHSHSTPLHQAVWAGHEEAVRLLLEKGARPDIRDTMWDGTPLDWAEHGGLSQMAALLRDYCLRTRIK